MTKYYEPFISVLIPTYNCEQFIEEAINSILAQDYKNLEIIVVDDGSTDNTENIVERFIDTRCTTSPIPDIRYFRKEHSGIAETRNMCLEKAKGEYIAWCDADDYWLKGKLQAQMKYFEEHPECEIVFTRFTNVFHHQLLENKTISINELENADPVKRYFASTVAKKEIFNKSGKFKKEHIVWSDIELLYRFESYNINMDNLINKVYYVRRLHDNNITLRKKPADAKQYIISLVLPNLRQRIRNQT